MATVSQTQPTIQLLLKSSDFVGALDLIYTTQEVLQQELSGIHCLRLIIIFNVCFKCMRCLCALLESLVTIIESVMFLLMIFRHLGSQLAELENAIERMMQCDFVSFLMQGLKQRLGSQERLSDQDEQTTEVCVRVCVCVCACVHMTRVVCMCVCVYVHDYVCLHVCPCSVVYIDNNGCIAKFGLNERLLLLSSIYRRK